MTSEAPSVTAATPSLSAPALRAGRSRTAGSSRVRSVISQVLLSLVLPSGRAVSGHIVVSFGVEELVD